MVTVVIPARNEADDIGRALDAVLDQDYPLDRMQVLVVDGRSGDATSDVASAALAHRGLLDGRVLHNSNGATPSNLNLGLTHAKGEYLCRVDARSTIPVEYVRRCVETLESRPDVAVVGGRQVAKPRDTRATSVGIARALNNRFLMGLSRYRRGARSGAVDTVYLGAFRVSQLRAVGGWDEALPTNQDFDLNRRMSRFGVVWFDGRLPVDYVPRRSLRALFAQYHRFGRSKVDYWHRTGDRPRPRQIALLTTPLVAGIVGVQLVADRSFSRRALTASTLLATAAALELRGSSTPPAPLAGHLISLLASAAVASGWLTGVGREQLAALLDPQRRAIPRTSP